MESSLRRAWKDTEQFRQSPLSFWGLEIVGASVLALVGGYRGLLLTPEDASPQQGFAYAGVGGVLGTIGGLAVTFLAILAVNLVRAPYLQRNELLSELSGIEGGKPISTTQAVTQLTQAVGRLSEKIALGTQPSAVSMIDTAEGLAETATGKPAFLVPIGEASRLGTVSQGSKGTITGLTVSDSPFFLRIPNLGYAMISIDPVGDEAFEATFVVYIETASFAPFTLALYVESYAVMSLIPARSIGFFIQKTKSPVRREIDIPLRAMSVMIQVDAGVVNK